MVGNGLVVGKIFSTNFVIENLIMKEYLVMVIILFKCGIKIVRSISGKINWQLFQTC